MANPARWLDFDEKKEITHLAEHIERTWDGLSLEQATAVVTAAFYTAWDAVGDHFERYSINEEHTSPLKMASLRRAHLKRLAAHPEDMFDDTVINVLQGLDALQEHAPSCPKFDDMSRALMKNVLKAADIAVRKARPKYWHRHKANLRHLLTEGDDAFEGFTGSLMSHPCIPYFPVAVSRLQVKHQLQEKGRAPLVSLASAIYAQALLLRIQCNNEKMGRALTDLFSEYTGSNAVGAFREPLALAYTEMFTPLFELAASKDEYVREAWNRVSWVNVVPQQEQTSGDFGM